MKGFDVKLPVEEVWRNQLPFPQIQSGKVTALILSFKFNSQAIYQALQITNKATRAYCLQYAPLKSYITYWKPKYFENLSEEYKEFERELVTLRLQGKVFNLKILSKGETGYEE